MATNYEIDNNQLSDNDAISDISDPDDHLDNDNANNNKNTKESIMSEIDNMLNELEITSNTITTRTQNINNSSNETTTKLNNSRFVKHTDNCENDSKAIQLRNKKTNSNTNRLDSIRYSMHALQSSQPSDIDALLSELCQLENNLNNLPANNIQDGLGVGSTCTVKKSPAHKLNGAQENLIINQQFDDVLKLISQSIDEPISVSIQSAQSSTAQSSVNTSPNNAKANSSSSSSSGISEDYKLTTTSINQSNNEIILNKQNTDQFQNIKSAINNNLNVINPQQFQQQQKLHSTTKRNSSDSAFSDSLSIPSSMSIVTLTTPAQQNDSINKFNIAAPIETLEMTPEQKLEFEKAEKIRIALEKLKEANIKKLIVKAFTDDGCTKTILIDETMRTYDIMLMLLTKIHAIPTVEYTIIEYLPNLFMKRMVEDHENLVEIMNNWTRDSENQIHFTQSKDKYDLFEKPELYLLNESSNKIDEGGRAKLLTEFFANIGSPVPEIEGFLYLKSESKKSWKKYYCILRQSGLYYVPKGKQKKDMQNLLSFEKVDLYYGVDWKKEYKAPTNFCFGLKYPQIQKVSPQYMKYMCCETDRECKRWVNGIRIAKFGKQLYDNYKKMYDLAEMSKISGFAALTNCRRLSASLNNRPKSSYSIGSNDKLDLPTPTMSTTNTMTKQPNLLLPHFNTQQIETKPISSSVVNTTVTQQNIEFRDNKPSINNDLDDERPPIPTHTSPYKMLQQPFVPLKTNNEVNSLLCKLKPTRTSSMYSTTSTSSTGTLNQKTAKLPVTTGITRQVIGNDMTSLPPQNDDELTNKFNQQLPIPFPATSTISKSPINVASDNIYDLPSPPAELLESSNTTNETHIQQTNFTSVPPPVPPQHFKPVPPPKLPKPQVTLPMVIQRNNSCDNRSSAGENAPIFRKLSNPSDNLNNRRSSNGNTRTSMSPNHNNNVPLVSEELNMILARQRKLIEIDTNNKTTNNDNENVSPRSQNKPVPPPRHDSTKLTGQLNNK